MHRWRVLSLAALGLCAAAGWASSDADRRVRWLREHAVAVRTVDPGDEDFTDLRPLLPLLGGVRVVVLGEASHGDGTTFLAKTRLVRFLHRELGFDVLAFESGFFDCWKAAERIQGGDDPDAAFRAAVTPIWTRSVQVQPLIAYFAAAARSARPLALAGIDPQLGPVAQRLRGEDLARLAAAVGFPADRFASEVAGPLANLTAGSYEAGELPPPAARAAFVSALADLERRLNSRAAALPDHAFWLRLLASTRDFAASAWAMDFRRAPLEQPEEYAVRERLMGETLVWLARERFAGRRIIVWMHSGHAFREVAGIDVPSPAHARLYRTLRPAGAIAHGALGKEIYVVGMVAYQGSIGTVFRRGAPEELLRPTAGSLEDLFHRTGLAQAFLDLGRTGSLPRWLREPLIARPIGYKEMRARWGEVFDGLLFLDRMERSEPLSRAPGQPVADGGQGVGGE